MRRCPYQLYEAASRETYSSSKLRGVMLFIPIGIFDVSVAMFPNRIESFEDVGRLGVCGDNENGQVHYLGWVLLNGSKKA